MNKEPLVVIVTGGSSGIGAATASRLAELGHRVFATSRDDHAPPHPRVEMLRLDVRDEESVRAMVAAVLERAGRAPIDVLVNNAGTMLFGPIEEVSLDDARALFETNFWGAARVTRAVLPSMRGARRGHIVNVGSIAGSVAIPMNGFYAATKHALVAYTEALRHEVEHLGIRVTLVEPGDVKSALWSRAVIAPGTIADYDSLRRAVLGRVEALSREAAGAEDVGDAIARIAAGESSPARVRIGAQARRLARMRAWMPSRLFERGLRRAFAIERLGRA